MCHKATRKRESSALQRIKANHCKSFQQQRFVRPVLVLQISHFTRRSPLQARGLCIIKVRSKFYATTPKSRNNKSSSDSKNYPCRQCEVSRKQDSSVLQGCEPISASLSCSEHSCDQFRFSKSLPSHGEVSCKQESSA